MLTPEAPIVTDAFIAFFQNQPEVELERSSSGLVDFGMVGELRVITPEDLDWFRAISRAIKHKMPGSRVVMVGSLPWKELVEETREGSDMDILVTGVTQNDMVEFCIDSEIGVDGKVGLWRGSTDHERIVVKIETTTGTKVDIFCPYAFGRNEKNLTVAEGMISLVNAPVGIEFRNDGSLFWVSPYDNALEVIGKHQVIALPPPPLQPGIKSSFTAALRYVRELGTSRTWVCTQPLELLNYWLGLLDYDKPDSTFIQDCDQMLPERFDSEVSKCEKGFGHGGGLRYIFWLIHSGALDAMFPASMALSRTALYRSKENPDYARSLIGFLNTYGVNFKNLERAFEASARLQANSRFGGVNLTYIQPKPPEWRTSVWENWELVGEAFNKQSGFGIAYGDLLRWGDNYHINELAKPLFLGPWVYFRYLKPYLLAGLVRDRRLTLEESGVDIFESKMVPFGLIPGYLSQPLSESGQQRMGVQFHRILIELVLLGQFELATKVAMTEVQRWEGGVR